ncbi:CD320 antigen [Frankliniella fusca]|uniref:CD320 antigen n=1 Tax=Frankliniella fusca TaxID=407009 RepID=A0AAE1HCL9_9NEOP|nr:CD320 antigen [Frankliniella fusca]
MLKKKFSVAKLLGYWQLSGHNDIVMSRDRKLQNKRRVLPRSDCYGKTLTLVSITTLSTSTLSAFLFRLDPRDMLVMGTPDSGDESRLCN